MSYWHILLRLYERQIESTSNMRCEHGADSIDST